MLRRIPVTSNHYRAPPSSHCSISIPRKFRYLIFPPGTTYHPPPPPPPPCSSIIDPPSSSSSSIVTHKPSCQSSSESVIVPHDRFQGVYVGNNGNTLFTKNLVPGQPPLYQDDVIISVKDDDDGSVVEYREWNPSKSKLAAAILRGAHNIWIKPGSRVLIIFQPDGEQFGTTISHVSDIVGPQGMVYVVDPSNWQTLASIADKRFNIVPIIQGHIPWKYRMLINMVDVLLAAPNHPDKVQVAYLNAIYFLKAGGHYMLYVQASCIESTNRGDPLFAYLGKLIQIQFKRMEEVTLEPFSRDHAYVIGAFRMLKVDEIEPSCLETDEFWTAQNSHRGDGEHVSLYEQQKNLPVYMLFESSCGYALFQAVDVYQVERNYIAIEEYVNCFDKFFKLIACHPFESADDALIHLNDVCNDTLHEQLIEFLVHYLPPPKKDGQCCYTIAAPTPLIGCQIVRSTNIACSASLFHDEIIRGVRMHVDKFFKNMKTGDVERGQLDLARSYCRQKFVSPDKGKPQKRGSFQASIPSSIPSRKNPKREARADAKTKRVHPLY